MKDEIIENVECEKLVWGGKGLARLDGHVILIDGALPGETVDIRIAQMHKDYAEARVVEVKKASPDRITPRCYHFGVCGGCDWQHLSYTGQIKAKEEIFKEVMSRGAGLDLDTKAEPSPQEWGYRSRVQWQWSGRDWKINPKGGAPIENMEECPISDPLLQAFMHEGAVPRYRDRYHLTTSGSQVLTDWQGEENGTLTVKGKEIAFSVKGFFQNNRMLLEPWIDFVTKDLEGTSLWDLYAGTGLLSTFLTDKFSEVTLVETSFTALTSARKNLGTEALLLKEDVLEFLADQKETADAVIVNPPRVGLDKRVVAQLKRLAPKNLIYISCNPTTLARDVKELKEIYDVEESRIFDFYPQTYHMEAVLRLTRKE